MRSALRYLGWLATALALGACASEQPGAGEAAATSCDGARLDGAGKCRTPGGQFAPSACCEWGPLPADLQVLSDRFDALVTPWDQQDELTFEVERFKLAGGEDWQRMNAVTVAEAQRIAQGSWVTHRFTVTDLRAMEEKPLDGLVSSLSTITEPYFCGTYKELTEAWDTPNYHERCMELTRELFQELADYESGLLGYLAKMEGNEWGDLEYVRLYVTSAQDKSQALVFDFDLVHEI